MTSDGVEMVTRNFRIAAVVVTAWFLMQMLGTRSNPMVYLLFALVQGMLLAVSFIRRRDLVLRLIAGVYGWNVQNIILPLYIGGSHVAYAVLNRES